MELRLREARDLDELMRWRCEVIRHVFGVSPSEDLLAANLDYYKHNIPARTHRAFIAKADGADAGCGAICLTEELPSPDNPSGRCAYLMNIYVRENFRKHGIGARIVEKLVETARSLGCDKIYLETTDLGRGVYSSLGFTDMPDMMKLNSH